ncbi:unnamed protein product, partial [Mesorhabditis belari]|uniref:Endonuclease/exonuclease/phosphatase domain-containing protein n=1 Tax=Mesorhabditis belari TaxID=2138241 RepID=A0AAF3F4P6_9BILA
MAIEQKRFRVLSLNLWVSAVHVENGLEKVAKHIDILEPDIIALQEVMNDTTVPEIIQLLKEPNKWKYAHTEDSASTAIISKYPIDEKSISTTGYSIHATIQLNDGISLEFWSVHTQYVAYGPHAAYNRMVTDVKQILEGENSPPGQGRVQNVNEILESKEMLKAKHKVDTTPIIIAGDFNSPSHLDWTHKTSDLHHSWVIEWPSTSLLEQAGFNDSYRVVHPDVLTNPGHTWSTCHKSNGEWNYAIPEPQDRIDFIFYQGPLKPLSSSPYAGTEPLHPIPNHCDNDWPSDHYALVTDFSFNIPNFRSRL